MHFLPGFMTILSLSVIIHANPTRSGSPKLSLMKRFHPKITNCHDEEHVRKSLDQVSGLAVGAYGVLANGDGWKSNKGYTHYFKESDYEQVKKAYELLMGIGDSIPFEIRCAPQEECVAGDFAYADSTPESFEGHGLTKGVRTITLCPPFFTDSRTTGNLPPADDQEGLKAYCKFKESKKVMDFEVGGHTLLHEITHLDAFGVAAGYPEVAYTPKRAGDFAYQYHGTIDWKDKSTAGNARNLKTSKVKNKPETWQNAESLAAAATEIGAMWRCDLKDIPY
ncbi:hypothetical protein PRK78_002593 [Emydomyces testavorans]|uniref:Deuterolysin n=1 Tax=Emydomyces testavorans TaxID=2070801 RepID=A0AAF0IHP8_9EURO|nr:hypothetical protein PRK78_002593 [Emydomyces testavorans]